MTGTVFCVGGTPDEVLEKFKEKLANFETEESLQVAVAQHFFNLFTNDETPEGMENELANRSTWEDKVNFCMEKLRRRVDHSIQYAREYMSAAYARILQVRRYQPEPRLLRSLLICIRPRSSDADGAKPSSIQSHSHQKVIEYELQAPLAYAAQDLRCAAIVNRHLDSDILEEFEKKNLCDTYFKDANSYMNTDIDVLPQVYDDPVQC